MKVKLFELSVHIPAFAAKHGGHEAVSREGCAVAYRREYTPENIQLALRPRFDGIRHVPHVEITVAIVSARLVMDLGCYTVLLAVLLSFDLGRPLPFQSADDPPSPFN